MNILAPPEDDHQAATREIGLVLGLGAVVAAVSLVTMHSNPVNEPVSIACDKVTYISETDGNYLIDVDWTGKSGGKATKLTIAYPQSRDGTRVSTVDTRPITQPETIYSIHPVFAKGDTAANSIKVKLFDSLGHTSLCANPYFRP